MKRYFLHFHIILAGLMLFPHCSGGSKEILYDLDKIEASKPQEMKNLLKDGDSFWEAGRRVYLKRCVFCHGKEGMGDGIAAPYLNPRPRDFTLGMFKFRSTKNAELPTDADLFRTVSRGVPGTAMPAWGEGTFTLPEIERWQAVYYVKSLAQDFQNKDLDPYAEGKKVEIPEMPKNTNDRIAEGKGLFGKPFDKPAPPKNASKTEKEKYKNEKKKIEAASCFKCHNTSGRANWGSNGNGGSVGEHSDDWGDPILPADLTKPWRYKNGSSVKDIYRTLTGGLNGTPMPSFADEALKTEDERWNVAMYVRSLQKPYSPDDNVLVAERVEENLPDDVNDKAWEKTKSIDVVTGGQVVVGPRWQNPSVDLIKMKALYNNREIVFLFSWNDRFKNVVKDDNFDLADPGKNARRIDPEEGVEVFKGKVTYDWEKIKALGDLWRPKDTYLTREAALIRGEIGNLPDQLAIHFPKKLSPPGSSRRPYLFMGNKAKPVNGWVWIAGKDRVYDTNSNGPESGYIHQKNGKVTPVAKAKFTDGQWKLLLKRKLTGDKGTDISFVPNRLIPFTLRGWDGANGEAGLQSSISAWHYVILKTGTPVKAYIWGLAGFLITLLLQFLIVKKVRRRDQ